jgi:hypothetical protein
MRRQAQTDVQGSKHKVASAGDGERSKRKRSGESEVVEVSSRPAPRKVTKLGSGNPAMSPAASASAPASALVPVPPPVRIVNPATEFYDDAVPKPPGQPEVSIHGMKHFLDLFWNRKHSQWKKAEKTALAAFMANRTGIIRGEESLDIDLQMKFNHFINEYVELYSTDAAFKAAIDPWAVIIFNPPMNNVNYEAELVLAAQFIGNAAEVALNVAGSRVQFIQGKNWLLHIPTGREDARRLLAFLCGRLRPANPNFGGIVMDYNLLLPYV